MPLTRGNSNKLPDFSKMRNFSDIFNQLHFIVLWFFDWGINALIGDLNRGKIGSETKIGLFEGLS